MTGRKWSSVVAAAAVFALAACGGADTADDTADTAPPATEPAPAPTTPAPVAANLPEGVTPEMVARGQTIFTTQTCFTCHGADATGTPLAPNLRDQTWLNTDGTYEGIIGIVTNGVPTPKEAPAPMLPMGGAQLSQDQIRDVAAYVYTLSHGG